MNVPRKPTAVTLATLSTYVLASLVVGLVAAVVYLVVRDVNQGNTLERQSREFQQQTVQARHDDCLAAEQLRSALRAQVRRAKKTEPLLLELVPSLNRPDVLALTRRNRQRQLRAYGKRDCVEFALRTVPPAERYSFRVLIRE